MPLFSIETNVPKEKVPAEFLKTASAALAKTLNKPEGYCTVLVKPGQDLMIFAGTTEPCGVATLMSVGQLDPEKNKAHSAVLFKLVKEKLGIPPTRFYIQYVNAKASDIGHNGSTLEGLV